MRTTAGVFVLIAACSDSGGPIVVDEGTLLRECDRASYNQQCDEGQYCDVAGPGDPTGAESRCVAIVDSAPSTPCSDELIASCPYNGIAEIALVCADPSMGCGIGFDMVCVCRPGAYGAANVSAACESIARYLEIECDGTVGVPSDCCSGRECDYVQTRAWADELPGCIADAVKRGACQKVSLAFELCRPEAFEI